MEIRNKRTAILTSSIVCVIVLVAIAGGLYYSYTQALKVQEEFCKQILNLGAAGVGGLGMAKVAVGDKKGEVSLVKLQSNLKPEDLKVFVEKMKKNEIKKPEEIGLALDADVRAELKKTGDKWILKRPEVDSGFFSSIGFFFVSKNSMAEEYEKLFLKMEKWADGLEKEDLNFILLVPVGSDVEAKISAYADKEKKTLKFEEDKFVFGEETVKGGAHLAAIYKLQEKVN